MDTPDVISDIGLLNVPEVMWDAFLCGIYRMKRIEKLSEAFPTNIL